MASLSPMYPPFSSLDYLSIHFCLNFSFIISCLSCYDGAASSSKSSFLENETNFSSSFYLSNDSPLTFVSFLISGFSALNVSILPGGYFIPTGAFYGRGETLKSDVLPGPGPFYGDNLVSP